MNTLLFIGTTHGGMFFSLTYLAAFLLGAGIMICEGFKRGYPKDTWLLILLTGVLFFIIGDKIFTYSPAQWTQVFTRFDFPVVDKKTVLGGITGLFAGILLAKSWLRFNRPVLDTLAIALPLAMAISRIGCLMAGCCFGTPTYLPWGIQYDAASPVYHVHLAQGLVYLHDKYSLAVHPAQLYQMIGCLVIAFLVWRSRKQWKSGGSLFLFSVLCYGILRFFVEFVRAPESNFFTGDFILGLKVIQWLILGAILPGMLILLLKEGKVKIPEIVSKGKANTGGQPHISDPRQVLLIILISISVFMARKWFDPLELSTILLFFIPAIIFFFVMLYRRHSVPGFRWVVPLITVCCFSFMAQKSNTPGMEDNVSKFTSVGLTGMIGSYYEELGKIYKDYDPGSSGSCGSPSIPPHYHTILSPFGSYQRTFYQGGIDISYNKWRGKYYKFSIGARGFLGSESGDMTAKDLSGTSIGVSPYFHLDLRWVGFGAGLTLGQMKLPLGHKDIEQYNAGDIISYDYRNYYVFPSISLRVGPSDLIYAEARTPALFPSSSPFFAFQVGVGSGLGKTNGTKVGVGYCQGIYALLAYPIKNKIVLEAYYGDNVQLGTNGKRVFSIGLHYRFFHELTASDSLKINAGETLRSLHSFSELRNTVSDIDGNVYHTVAVGGQVWMAENLTVTRYRDGSLIPDVTGNVSGNGRQYNWSAVNHEGNLCPAGWHVPSLKDWTSLINSIGGSDVAGSKLEKNFNTEGEVSKWWSSTEKDSLNAHCIYLNNKTTGVLLTTSQKTNGLTVRCLRDL